jgi:hypothetical protein
MKQKKIIPGMKFGRLTVISKSSSVQCGSKTKKYQGSWLCKCDCGNEKIVKTTHLNRGRTKSCGCLISQYGRSLKPGDRRNNLTVISYNKGKWLCHCICGNITEVSTYNLNNNNTKSCGCIKTEVSSKKAYKLIEERRKYAPDIASARRVWKNMYRRNKNDNIDFDTFFKYSQENCFYCGIEPSNKYNYFMAASSRGSNKAKDEGEFIYNGLDRINSDGYHTADNVVTCCYLCNRSKNDRSIDEFLSWANKLEINKVFNGFKLINYPANPLASSIKCAFYMYKKDTDLSVQEFYSISQMNCHYCNTKPSNFYNRYRDKKATLQTKEIGSFYYNGLDRIDSNLSHNKDNVVPCCKYCNFAKGKLSLQEFSNWVSRIQKHQKQKEPGNKS